MAKPTRRRSRAPKTTAPEPEVVEEEKPTRRSRRRKPAPVEEPEVIEEEDDLPEALGGNPAKEEKALVPATQRAVAPLTKKVGGKLGMEELDANDLIIPYMKIMQPTSPEVLDRKHEAQMGDLVNSLSSYLYPEDVYFVPIKALKRRQLYYKREDKENSGIECGSMNFKTPDSGMKYSKLCATCPKAQFKADGTPPKCNILLSFISKVLELPEGDEGNALIAISFTKTSYKAGKILASLAQSAKGDLFNNIYKLTTADKENDKGMFAILKVAPFGIVPDGDVAEYRAMYDMLTTTEYEIVEENYTEFDEKSASKEVQQDTLSDEPPSDDIPDVGDEPDNDDGNPFGDED